MTTQFTFAHKYAAHRSDDKPYVFVPDQVYESQSEYDGKEFPIIFRNGTTGRAILRGELYGLNTPGTGDITVEVIEG